MMQANQSRHTDPNDAQILTGTVRRILVPLRDNGWGVLILAVDGDSALCAGTFPPDLAKGSRLTCVGEWPAWQGKPQFKVASSQTQIDRTREGIAAWLCTIKGIGPKKAARIFDHFAAQADDVADAVWSILRDTPERVLEVPTLGKIGPSIVEKIREQTVVGELLTWLMSFGISAAYCRRILDRYGIDAVTKVRANPYLLTEIRGIGFKRADAIGLKMGIAADSPHRIQAGLLFVLEQSEGRGHCYLPDDELVMGAVEVLTLPDIAIEPEAIEPAVQALVDSGRVVRHAWGIASVALFEAENTVAAWLAEAVGMPGVVAPPEHLLSGFERRVGITLHPDQRRAIAMAATAPVSVITGGPGTGKTTLLQALLAVTCERVDRVRLCAPTGRAAKRMSETSGRQGYTIHRLLQWREGQRREGLEPLGVDLVIVDEMSMVDVRLMAALVSRLRPDCRLVLIGDADQLPSVGPGNVLKDLLESGAIPSVRLTHIQRQAASSMIVMGAHAMNHGEFPKLCDVGEFRAGAGQLAFQACEESADIPGMIEGGIAYLADVGYSRQDIAIMAPQRTGPAGVQAINLHLQSALNPKGQPVVNGRGIRLGDKVMHIRNNYRLDTFNGDVGHVVSIPAISEDEDDDAPVIRCVVDYGDRHVKYTDEDLEDLVLAYCSTIHKMQGSESPACLIVCHPSHYHMLSRRLIYTAITRGKELVCLVGTTRGIGRACSNVDDGQRYTTLWKLLS